MAKWDFHRILKNYHRWQGRGHRGNAREQSTISTDHVYGPESNQCGSVGESQALWELSRTWIGFG